MPLNNKLLVPVALGFSLVTVTAFVVYYIFKKEEENDSKPVRSTKFNLIEVQVPKSIVPALIGRNGSNIKQIEDKSGASIHFKKFSEEDYDVCIIRGQSNASQIAETMVHDFINQQPVIVENSISVPGWACGRIIGTGGENINDISHRSGARVKLEGERGADLSTQRKVVFRGTAEQIHIAKGLIEECVEQERCRREVEQAKRSPRVSTPPHVPLAPLTPHTPDATGDVTHVKRRTEPSSASIEVYVSASSSPSRFWVQFVGPQVAQLDDLVAHMTEYYGNKENRASHALVKVSVGQVVAAVFRHDGRWYRARVMDLRPNEFDATQQVADLFFLDYGDSEYVATHELCELRADLLRLRFQAMECFLAGVRPVNQQTRWHPQAVERFEDLVQVARWKPLVSRTCTYKKSSGAVGERGKEVPGIKLYDVTDAGSLDIGEVLVREGWAEPCETAHSVPATPHTPFGDLSHSRVLGMLGGARAASLPKERAQPASPAPADAFKDNATSRSLASGLESADKIKSISNFDLAYPDKEQPSRVNGSDDFIASERDNIESETSHLREEFKANMNRIDSHHSNLEALGRQ
ncbi:tudor and KH domain-containing protein homolog isoform X1 [Vanessa atalanta]|uniref:tudor and KH domain-containing protein homolog isoform X1 n=2 Tax=Vanessa atalanta TaxID=42275 RepID=UPI001FCD3C22|nr:tudor and KH domain-containing protein homolog isoform X1 [Vanessa atalanta]XP_047535203.1 tudor and KH domain-containing protein homolog isoform X1 [Vanessa atalanta]